jgi:hypothetical protein
MKGVAKKTKRTRPASFGDPTLHDRQIDAGHEARLLANTVKTAEPDEAAFLVEARGTDPLAEHLGEAFVETVTSGEDDEEERLDAVVPEETGGPFVQSAAQEEFAKGTDASNPRTAKKEPFPTT